MATDELAPEAFVAAVKPVTEPEEKSSKLSLRTDQMLMILLGTVPLYGDYASIAAFIEDRQVKYLLSFLFFMYVTFYIIMCIRNLEKRIRRIPKKLNN